MTNGTITLNDGRTVGFADYGTPDQTAVLWCHGGPGSRLEPSMVVDMAGRAGLRLVGIDRPGYGLSTPQPGRTIGGWVAEALTVADHLGIDRFAVVGISTGGAYALALASSTPRVIAAVPCCAISDMRWLDGRAMNVGCHPVWNARSREEAFAIVSPEYGERGARLLPAPPHGDASDLALFATPAFQSLWASMVPDMVTFGVAGYVDDRLADKNGWDSFDVANVTCPVAVLHGSTDILAPVAQASHTAAIVPGATLRVIENLGHISIIPRVVEVMIDTLAQCEMPVA